MPHHSKLARSKAIQDAYSIASVSVLDFLAPTAYKHATHSITGRKRFSSTVAHSVRNEDADHDRFFFSAISTVSCCSMHQRSNGNHRSRASTHGQSQKATFGALSGKPSILRKCPRSIPVRHIRHMSAKNDNHSVRSLGGRDDEHVQEDIILGPPISFRDYCDDLSAAASQLKVLPPDFFNDRFEKAFAEGSNLPLSFYDDISNLKSRASSANTPSTQVEKAGNREAVAKEFTSEDGPLNTVERVDKSAFDVQVLSNEPNIHNKGDNNHSENPADILEGRLKLLKSVRELEEKLAKAKHDLSMVMSIPKERAAPKTMPPTGSRQQDPVLLTKEDYTNLVDLYYYSHNSRFSPEASDMSPTPSFLDDVSFKISEDFSEGERESVNEKENYVSPLKEVERMLINGKLREIAVMRLFIDLLTDEHSSNRALYEAYKNLPEPGVSYLPKGVRRLFLQRMSTPWTHSEKSMLRYLALIDDMQKAGLPITTAEWSSAVYLAGRSFAKVMDSDVSASFATWQRMESQAGVQSSHVTFNILFDIAVRAGKFALGQTILSEMSHRNLRLNRLGRVSLIYYHGLRGDGDGVRKTYRDFVESGEIVDTLVLNCVIAALLNSQEPTAADQVYERMKSLQSRLRDGVGENGSEGLYVRYPPHGGDQIGREMASNHLGRILEKAKHLREVLPEHHSRIQAAMPLTPDIKTFSTMIAYHATKSGDLDRISVLLMEMTDLFGIPLQPLVFQLLFKGFALHGPIGGPDGQWTIKRLDACWNACRLAIKNSGKFLSTDELKKLPQAATSEGNAAFTSLSLPTMNEINTIAPDAPLPSFNPHLHNPPQRRLSEWHEFVLDLAAFPRERLRRIERFHAQMFDDENAKKPHESGGPHTFSSPFFQSTVYTAPEPALDHEEGEYVLPNPAETTLMQPNSRQGDEPQVRVKDIKRSSVTSPIRHSVTATRPLVCWLLRAYARNTKSRAKVEEVWGSVRKIWRPRDEAEIESVVRVLRRCLRDCDREGGG